MISGSFLLNFATSRIFSFSYSPLVTSMADDTVCPLFLSNFLSLPHKCTTIKYTPLHSYTAHNVTITTYTQHDIHYIHNNYIVQTII